MPMLMLRDSLISYTSSAEEYTVPSVIRRIAANAFYDNGRLTRLTIPDSVTEIGDYAFKLCYNMTSIRLPLRVEKFGVGMFQQCRKLQEVVLPEGIRAIDAGMFVCCDSLRSLTIPSSVEGIAAKAFTGCLELREILVMPEQLELLPENCRKTACVSYMNRHAADEGSALIDEFVLSDPVPVAELAIRGNDKNAVRYMTDHGLLSGAETAGLIAEANARKRTEIAAMLLQANRERGEAPGEALYEMDPFA